jgi:hypothetical protein
MLALDPTVLALPAIDWIAIGACLVGLLTGALVGLGRAFGALLWVLAALWLAHHLSETVVGWLPNTTAPDDPSALRLAFAGIACLVLLVPIVARILGGAAGRKRNKAPVSHKPFGALVGLTVAVVLLTAGLPYLAGLPWVGRQYPDATAPTCASGLADQLRWLFPPSHREALAQARLPREVDEQP